MNLIIHHYIIHLIDIYDQLMKHKNTRITIPVKVRNLVVEWADQHKKELLADWELAQSGIVPNKIKPLV